MPGHPADQADIAGIGPGAAIRAAGDAERDALLGQAVARQHALDLPQDRRADPFGLGQRQTAGGERRAGQCPAGNGSEILGQGHAMGAQDRLHLGAGIRRQIGQQQILLRGGDRVGAEALHHLPHRAAQRDVLRVLDAAGGDGQAEPEPAIALRVPAQQFRDLEARQQAGRRQRLAVIAGEFGAHAVRTIVIDDVFQPRPPPVAAVAMVALEADDGLRGAQQVVRPDEGDGRGQARIGIGPVMRHAQAAADAELIALQHAAFEEGDEAEIVAQHIDRVVAAALVQMGDADLEFPRQIGGAIERLLLLAGSCDRLLIQEDLVMRPAARQQGGGEHSRIGQHAGMGGMADRGGAGHDRAHHIAAGRLLVSRARLMAAMAGFTFSRNTPWNWTDCRVVTRSVQLP